MTHFGVMKSAETPVMISTVAPLVLGDAVVFLDEFSSLGPLQAIAEIVFGSEESVQVVFLLTILLDTEFLNDGGIVRRSRCVGLPSESHDDYTAPSGRDQRSQLGPDPKKSNKMT